MTIKLSACTFSRVFISELPDGKDSVWDDFVGKSINSTFLHTRRYSRYRNVVVPETNLLFYEKEIDRPIAIMTGVVEGKKIVSVPHLTYGGILFLLLTDYSYTKLIFETLAGYMKKYGLDQLVYRPTPMIYHKQPFALDLFFLESQPNCKMTSKITSVIDCSSLTTASILSSRKKRNLRNFECQKKLRIVEDFSHIESFWSVLEVVLMTRHNTTPAHTFLEIQELHNLFPEQVKLGVVMFDEEVLAGVLYFCTPQVWHCQYIANSDEGRRVGALDGLILHLIQNCSARYFDFGVSNETNGELNSGLFAWKNEFGAGTSLYQEITWIL